MDRAGDSAGNSDMRNKRRREISDEAKNSRNLRRRQSYARSRDMLNAQRELRAQRKSIASTSGVTTETTLEKEGVCQLDQHGGYIGLQHQGDSVDLPHLPHQVASCSNYSLPSEPNNLSLYGNNQCAYEEELQSDDDGGIQNNQQIANFSLHNICTECHVLVQPKICSYCGAKIFHRESKGFCCSDGKVKLYIHSVPDELYQLFTSNSAESLSFKKIARSYNNHFAFTSFGVKCDKDLCRMNKGIYTFRVQGQVHHYINQLLPSSDNNPSYLQLYFYDTEKELTNRLNLSDKFCASTLQVLIDILKINPYCKFFRSLSNIDNLHTCQIQIRCNPGLDQRVYNTPTASQVAAIWVDDDPSANNKIRDILIYGHSGTSHRVHYYFGCYDPLQYPLLFPFGESGWCQGIERIHKEGFRSCTQENVLNINNINSADELIERENEVMKKGKKRSTVSCREYYCFKLQIRNSGKSFLLHTGRLFQQYVVDMYVKIETARLDYFRNNQKQIRGELYQGIVDSVEIGESRGHNIGRRIILPSSFTGGPRDNKKRYMDAMALVQRYGKPDVFLTMTCNPNWREIEHELKHNDEKQNRPDLLARIFRAKLEELKCDLFKRHILGPVAAYIYVVEFQKRGLPHAHFLLIFKSGSKINSVDLVDKIVCCEIPDKNIYPHLYPIVVKHMLHGPCGILNPNNVCMLNNICKNKYPRDYTIMTSLGNDSYPKYKRRDDGRRVKVRGHFLDNRWIVPYNPYLTSKYDCHINVEICSSVKAVKYLYKYVYKGHDRIAFSINDNQQDIDIDEISRYQTARWISPPEAMWRIYGFVLSEMSPSVVSLQLHLQDCQLITYRDTDNLQAVINRDYAKKTMLTEFFCTNITNEKARTLTYRDFPSYFVWDANGRIWTPRKQKNVIGRIVTANPSEGERYYLRLLLNHIKGSTSFEELKTVNGRLTSTFREAALLHGLLNGDNNCELCLAEAIVYEMPSSLRRLFATILTFCAPNNPQFLWDKFKSYMFEDFIQQGMSFNVAQIKALQSIHSILEPLNKSINDYKLVPFNINIGENEILSNMISEELNYAYTDSDNFDTNSLNEEQQYAYNTILHRILNDDSGMFFVDGPGGTGKTYLYKALLVAVRSKNLIAIATASSGVAASLLPGGRTAHSKFKIPLEINDDVACSISKQSALAELFRMTKLIIWDEAPMVNRYTVEALDKMLRDINGVDVPFGGKVIVLGGDFRQVLPIVQRGKKEDIMKASLVFSYLWPSFTHLPLVRNMRAELDPLFCDYLLRIGNGTEKEHSCQMIQLPADIVVHFEDEFKSLKHLIDIVFPNIENYKENLDTMINRVILTPKNEYVDQINNILLKQIPGNVFTYFSFDESIDRFEQSIQEDFLNTLTPNGIPPHELTLKQNCPVILLRNINPSEGLCNGTRLICRRFDKNVIDAEIAIGEYRGKRVFLPRIPFIPLESDKTTISFKRTQFPIRPCFAMTINKSQGQTLDFVGLYLPESVFSHGQLYVALSRAKTSKAIRVLIKPSEKFIAHTTCTKNVVYKEILALVTSS